MQDQYYFSQVDGEIITVTDINTRITWLNAKGGVALIPTAKSRLRYNLAASASSLRAPFTWVPALRRISLF